MLPSVGWCLVLYVYSIFPFFLHQCLHSNASSLSETSIKARPRIFFSQEVCEIVCVRKEDYICVRWRRQTCILAKLTLCDLFLYYSCTYAFISVLAHEGFCYLFPPSLPYLCWLCFSSCDTVPSVLMTHISYLQSLPNPSSTSSETDYCLQTPEERTEERGGGCKVEIDASMIQYTEETKMCACVDHVCKFTCS